MNVESSILPNLPQRGNSPEWGTDEARWGMHTMGHHSATKGEGPLLYAQPCRESNTHRGVEKDNVKGLTTAWGHLYHVVEKANGEKTQRWLSAILARQNARL